VVDASAGGSLGTSVCPTHGSAGLAGVVTRLVPPAVTIRATLHIDTCNQWVALETNGTDAASLVEVDLTLCTATTRSVSAEAGIEAVLVDAGLVHRAVIVNPALGSVALAVGVATIALWTSAHRVVHPGGALGLWGTWVLHDARVDTVLVDACLVHGTL